MAAKSLAIKSRVKLIRVKYDGQPPDDVLSWDFRWDIILELVAA